LSTEGDFPNIVYFAAHLGCKLMKKVIVTIPELGF
jgi:hypothetical protein